MINGNIYIYNGKNSSYDEIIKNEKITLNIQGENNKIILNDFNGQGTLYLEMKCDNSQFVLGSNNTINNQLSVFFQLLLIKELVLLK